MKTHDELALAKAHPDPCGRCALSVVLVDEELDLLREKYRKIGDFSAKGELRADLGVMHTNRTPTQTHTNVWFYRHVSADTRASLFAFHRSLT